jgi:hypothetical protein
VEHEHQPLPEAEQRPAHQDSGHPRDGDHQRDRERGEQPAGLPAGRADEDQSQYDAAAQQAVSQPDEGANRFLITRSPATEATKLTESSPSTLPAPNAAASSPPRGGPITHAADSRLSCHAYALPR